MIEGIVPSEKPEQCGVGPAKGELGDKQDNINKLTHIMNLIWNQGFTP